MKRRKPNKKRTERFFANNRIRAREVRLIDEDGEQLGVISIQEALKRTREKNLDLIQVSGKTNPPVCKMGELGKFLYQKQKKEKRQKKTGGETKNVRLTYNISSHDMETRAKSALKFLNKGDKVRVEMKLRGREKAHIDFAKEKLQRFLEQIAQSIPYKMEKEIKKEGRGLTIIISKQ